MRAIVAPAPSAIAAKSEADPPRRRLRAALSSRCCGESDAGGDGPRLARLSRQRRAFAASFVAEHGMAEAQSMVRSGTGPRVAAQSLLCACLMLLAACVP